MCKLKKYHKTSNTQIDKCMRKFIEHLEVSLKKDYKILACCCGHKKYPMTIIIEDDYKKRFDLVSGIYINRKRKFYKRDKQGYYYIPEVNKIRGWTKWNVQ